MMTAIITTVNSPCVQPSPWSCFLWEVVMVRSDQRQIEKAQSFSLDPFFPGTVSTALVNRKSVSGRSFTAENRVRERVYSTTERNMAFLQHRQKRKGPNQFSVDTRLVTSLSFKSPDSYLDEKLFRGLTESMISLSRNGGLA
jgi:hypothetical protein